MSQWYDRKKKGLCTKCGLRAGTSKRGLLCDSCLNEVKARNEPEPPRP